jgi:alkylated DNA nucleotide flippase Atl1
MDRDGVIKVVRNLTRLVVERFCPAKLEDFEDDFATCALSAGAPGVSENPPALTPPARGLDTTLVAGMFFQVVMEASRLPAGSQERVSFIRKKAKDYLVTQLAGQITLSQFYRLLNLIEEEVGLYFARQDWTGVRPPLPQTREAAPLPPSPELVKGEALRQALAKIALPTKGRRKLTPETLWDFLRETKGGWFRLLDFEARFQVNKKTAWGYLNLLLQEGILVHNGEKANRVRYALAASFKANAGGPPGAEPLQALPSPSAGPG